MKKNYLFSFVLLLVSSNLFSQANSGNPMFKIEVEANHQVTVSNLEGKVVAKHVPSQQANITYSDSEKLLDIDFVKNQTELQLAVQQKDYSSQEQNSHSKNYESFNRIQGNSTARMQKCVHLLKREQTSSNSAEGPNLIIYKGTGSKNTYEYNESSHELAMFASIANIGTASAMFLFSGFYLSTDQSIDTTDFCISNNFQFSLSSGYYLNLSDTVDLDNFNLQKGTYYLGFIVDNASLISETDETDNTLCIIPPINYGVSPLPNLAFYKGTGSGNSFQYNESTHTFDVTFSVANYGPVSAGTFRVGCYVSTDTLITTNDYKPGSSVNMIGGLGSGKFFTSSKSACLDNISELPKGTYYFGLIIDDLSEVTESNDNDNAACYKPNVSYTSLSLSVSQNIVAIDNNVSNSKSIIISSNTSWNVRSDQSWLTVSPASGTGNGTLIITANQNPTSSQRSAIVTVSATGVSSQIINATQGAANSVSNIKDEIATVFPNPASEYITFNLGDKTNSTLIEFYNMTGDRVLSQMLPENNRISVRHLPHGCYCYKLIKDGKQFNGRIAIK